VGGKKKRDITKENLMTQNDILGYILEQLEKKNEVIINHLRRRGYMTTATETSQTGNNSMKSIIKFLFFSIFGMLLFFMPVTINGSKTIPLDHLLTWINTIAPWFGPIFTLGIAIIGGILPWYDKTFKKSIMDFVLSVFRLAGIPICFMAYLNVGPEWLMDPGMLPFVWSKIVIAVTMIVPIGSLFLTLIICFGALEFIGVIVRPIMRPVFGTPGKSAIDAVASFVGSFSVAIFLTNRLYKESKYTAREAITIMTGFSTVSATFMIIIAKTAQFMDIWNFYFWSTLLICFVVTAITVRIYPIRAIPAEYKDGVGKPEIKSTDKTLVAQAWDEGVNAAANSGEIHKSLAENVWSGLKMCFVLTPCIASIGILAFILVKMTPVFSVFGLIFFPFTWFLSLFGLPEPMMVAKACAVVLGEMFVPNVLIASFPPAAKYIVAVTSVSSIIFFGGSIPCMLATEIGTDIIPFWKLLLIWFERTALTILIAGTVALIYFG